MRDSTFNLSQRSLCGIFVRALIFAVCTIGTTLPSAAQFRFSFGSSQAAPAALPPLTKPEATLRSMAYMAQVCRQLYPKQTLQIEVDLAQGKRDVYGDGAYARANFSAMVNRQYLKAEFRQVIAAIDAKKNDASFGWEQKCGLSQADINARHAPATAPVPSIVALPSSQANRTAALVNVDPVAVDPNNPNTLQSAVPTPTSTNTAYANARAQQEQALQLQQQQAQHTQFAQQQPLQQQQAQQPQLPSGTPSTPGFASTAAVGTSVPARAPIAITAAASGNAQGALDAVVDTAKDAVKRPPRMNATIFEMRSAVPEVAVRAATDMFMTSLVKTRKFRVIERQRLNEGVNREREMNAQGITTGDAATKQLKGAGVIFEATISEMDAAKSSSSTGLNIAGLRFGGETAKDSLGIDVRVLNAATGEVLDAINVRKEIVTTSKEVGGFGALVDNVLAAKGKSTKGFTPDGSNRTTTKDGLDETLRALIDDAVTQLAKRSAEWDLSD